MKISMDRVRKISAFVAILFCLSLVAPGGAIAKPDDPGNSAAAHDKKNESSESPVQQSVATPAPDESTTVALESDGIVDTKSTPPSQSKGSKKSAPVITQQASPSPSPAAKGGGNGNGKGNGGGGGGTPGGGNAYDPDPPPVATPPSTTGPGTCSNHGGSQGNPYSDDNCDGSQGQNGNGGNGKCAGCTGKADDKAPGGQYPGDHNNGYECDHNKGVGKGNPAHSKCSTTPPPCQTNCNPGCKKDCNPPCQVNCNPGCKVNCNPPCQVNCNPPCQVNCNPCVDDMDTDEDECDEDDVLGEIIHRAAPEAPAAPAVLGERVNQAVLPYTGASNIKPMISLGLMLVAIGAFAMALTIRRRRQGQSV